MSQKGEAELLEDCSGVIKLYSDGSIVRADDSSILPEPDNFNYKHVEYKGVVMDEAIGLWARLYLPPETNTKLAPVIIYYHGGGFCICSPATPVVHHMCQMWAATLAAVIVSVIGIKRLILVYPYFGGEDRTASEKENSPVLSLEQSDVMWRLALPVGSIRDHPFSNRVIGAAASALDLPPVLFVIAGRDILRDRQLQYCEFLKKRGKQICVHVCEGENHGFFFLNMEEPSSVEALRRISDFIK